MIKLTRFLIFFFSLSLFAQEQSTYSKAKISLSDKNIVQLASTGVCTDHGYYDKGKSFTSVFSEKELDKITEAGFVFEIIVEDVQKAYLEHKNDALKLSAPDCPAEAGNSSPTYDTPTNFELGSMGGFFTYDEMLGHLDNMATLFPNLITVKEALPETPEGISVTHENRPIYMVKISDNPNDDEDEKEMVYTAIHHAREPGSMSQLIFYMYYLLENYQNDPQVQAIVNNTELYFIPCINPDGYIYNETTNPNGGGFWRKNRRNNGDGTFGVDLNRNYAYEWGFDDTGSSPDTDSDTYRGPSPASEPETQLVTNFISQHNFEITLNYHSYGGLLIYPWGYSDSPTPDSPTFVSYGKHMTQHNNYTTGTGTETVGYTVNGDSDDWGYGEQEEKNKIITMTPEVGDAFWQNESQIIPMCKENMFPNLESASLLLNHANISNNSTALITSNTHQIEIALQRLGLEDGNFTISFESSSTAISSLPDELIISDVEFLATTEQSFDFSINDGIENGTEITINLLLNNGYFTSSIPLNFTYNNAEAILVDNANNLENWNDSGWDLTEEFFVSDNSSITDSPNDNYDNFTISNHQLASAVDLTNATTAYISYFAKWDIENNYDYVQIQARDESGEWEPLCGNYTNEGTDNQDEGEPLYDGTQVQWVQEYIDLSDYFGNSIDIRFRLRSDAFETGDGFYFDDFKIHVENGNPTSIDENKQVNFNIYPNPGKGLIALQAFNADENIYFNITNELGQNLQRINLDKGEQKSTVNTEGWASGIYFIQMYKNNIHLSTQKYIKL